MKPENGTFTGLMPARQPGTVIVPTLIRVPSVSGRSATRTTGRHSWPTRPRRRRRLRREVRRAGAALLIGVILTLGLLPILGGRLAGRSFAGDSSTTDRVEVQAEPIVSLSAVIEPSSPRDLSHHVFLPGFIEPDDGAEEATHGRN